MSASPARAPRVLFYVQHLLGIGHLARASRIAQALAARGAAVTVLSGGVPVPSFPGLGVNLVQLPALRAADGDFSALVDAGGRPADAAFLDARRQALLDTFERLAPDMLVIEAFPFGRRPLRFELLPLLAAAHTRRPRPLIACSVRDIVQASRKPGRAEETVATLEGAFDRVLVHGDPALCRFEASFPLAGRIGQRLVYTGLVAGPRAAPASERYAVVVSVGGGAVGTALLETAMAARAATSVADAPWCLLAGSNTAEDALLALRATAPAGVTVERFRPDFPALLAGAAVSVSQAGYNTVCDVLRAGCRAVLVPYTEAGETEQAARAAHLAARGLALIPDAPGAAALARAIDAALALPRPPTDGGLDLDGAATSARLLLEGAGATSHHC